MRTLPAISAAACSGCLLAAPAAHAANGSGTSLESLATLPLGTNRALHLVRAGTEVVLLGSAEHGVTPIRRFSEAEAIQLGLLDGTAGATLDVLPDLPAARQPQTVGGLLDALRR